MMIFRLASVPGPEASNKIRVCKRPANSPNSVPVLAVCVILIHHDASNCKLVLSSASLPIFLSQYWHHTVTHSCLHMDKQASCKRVLSFPTNFSGASTDSEQLFFCWTPLKLLQDTLPA